MNLQESGSLALAYFEELCLFCDRFDRTYNISEKKVGCVKRIAKLVTSQEITHEMLEAALNEVTALKYPADLRIALQILQAPDPGCYESRQFLSISSAYNCYENGRYQVGGNRQNKFNNKAVYAVYKRKRCSSKEEFEQVYRQVCADIAKSKLVEHHEPEVAVELLEPNLEGMKKIADIAKQAFANCHAEVKAPAMTHEQLNEFYDQHLREIHKETKP